MESLYRIISFPEFVNLVERNSERYRRPTAWEDTHEAFMLQLLSDDSHMDEVLKTLYVDMVESVQAVIVNYLKLWTARWLCYGQCWSKTAETDAMWRIYSFDRKSIRIETDIEAIQDMLATSELGKQYSVVVDDVQYDLDLNADLTSQTLLLKKFPRTVEPFFHKREFFKHEDEKRVILFDRELAALTSGFTSYCVSFNVCKKIENEKPHISEILDYVKEELLRLRYPFEMKKLPENLLVPNIDLTKYVKSVMVHPQAEKWIVDLVKVICEKNNLNFLGKSKMYEKLC